MLPNNRHAILDLGTNIFNLLIVEVNESQNKFKTIYKEKIPVKIGEDGISQGIINEEAQKRIIQAFYRFTSTLQAYQVSLNKVNAVATSAFRSAKNGQLIALHIFQQFGIAIDIIGGNQEAQYIYEGVRQAVDMKNKTSLIMDIGGGSVEFIIANGNKLFWKHSFEIGGQRLFDKFMRTDPISQLDLQRMEIYLETALLELTEILFSHIPQILIGSAGAFETIVAMLAHLNDYEKELVDEHGELFEKSTKIDKNDFYVLYQKVIASNLEQRKLIPGMLNLRADTMVIAMALVKFIIEKTNPQQIIASSYALKEGVLFNKLLTIS